MGGQWPRTIRARLGACRYTIGRARYRFLVLEGRVMQGGRAASQCGPQCGRTMHARRFCNRYTIGYRSVSFYSTVGAGNAGRPVAASQCVPGWVRVVTPLGVLGIGGKSPYARHGRFPSSPQLNCAYSTSGESPRTMRYGRWRWSYILWAPRPEPLKNTFPRREGGRAYARSDEKRRNVPIMSAVHKKGTILKAVPSYLTALYVVSCRHSSSAPSGAPSPLGKVLLR